MYDPLGFISPVFVKVRVIFQDLRLDKRDWDDDIPEPPSKWLHYVNQLKDVRVITVPRYVSSPLTDNIQHVFIHGFSDSSKYAYSAVVYLQVQSSNGFMSRLITPTTKVAPVQELTTPRLELLACLLLANLMCNVCNIIDNIYCIKKRFSDSINLD